MWVLINRERSTQVRKREIERERRGASLVVVVVIFRRSNRGVCGVVELLSSFSSSCKYSNLDFVIIA